MQSAIRDGRLKFEDRTKSQIKIDLDPLQVADAHYAEPFVVNMVEVSEVHDRNAMIFETTKGFKQETTKGFMQGNIMTEATEGLRAKLEKLEITDGASLEVNMVEIGQGTEMEADERSLKQDEKHVKVAYPKNDESLVEFLHRFQRKRSNVMFSPGAVLSST